MNPIGVVTTELCVIAEQIFSLFFFQAEDGIRDRSPSRGLGDVYKRQTFWREGGDVFFDSRKF